MKQQRKMYDSVFKQKAVELSQERSNISELARELGIRVTLLYKCCIEKKMFIITHVWLRELFTFKLELNRQRSMGSPLNRLTITGEDTEYLTREEVPRVLNVTVQTLNNWRREGVLNPIKIGGRVLYRKEDVYNNSRLVA